MHCNRRIYHKSCYGPYTFATGIHHNMYPFAWHLTTIPFLNERSTDDTKYDRWHSARLHAKILRKNGTLCPADLNSQRLQPLKAPASPALKNAHFCRRHVRLKIPRVRRLTIKTECFWGRTRSGLVNGCPQPGKELWTFIQGSNSTFSHINVEYGQQNKA